MRLIAGDSGLKRSSGTAHGREDDGLWPRLGRNILVGLVVATRLHVGEFVEMLLPISRGKSE